MSTITASPPIVRWPRAAFVTIAVLALALALTAFGDTRGDARNRK
jgi:hypothetical protein